MFNITQFSEFSYSEIENMIPFERTIFLDMILAQKEAQENG
jgi:hypothetical protein